VSKAMQRRRNGANGAGFSIRLDAEYYRKLWIAFTNDSACDCPSFPAYLYGVYRNGLQEREENVGSLVQELQSLRSTLKTDSVKVAFTSLDVEAELIPENRCKVSASRRISATIQLGFATRNGDVSCAGNNGEFMIG